MIFSKKPRRRQNRPGLRDSILPGMHISGMFTTGSLFLAVLLITAMGMLFTSYYKTDPTNCPCMSLTKRDMIDMHPIDHLTDHGNDAQSSARSKETHVPKSRDIEQSKMPTAGPNKFKSEWWKNHTRTVCKMLGFSTNQSTLRPNMLSKVLVDDTNKILYCQIAKVASTYLGKIFAIIAGKFNGTDPNAIDSSDIHWKYNKLQVHLDSFSVQEIVAKLQRYFKFVFVRDPFERLLSGYRNKFLKPSNNFFAYFNNKLVKKYRTNTTQTGGVTFSEFVAYLVDKERKVPMNGHWQPMHELCRPCETNYDFVGKMNSLGEDVLHILEVNNLMSIMDVPKQSPSHSFHKTDLFLEQYYSIVPKPLLVNLYKMYYPDYAIFDFPVPEVILKMLK